MPGNDLHALEEPVAYGAGPPLVLVHGSASDRRSWDRQIEAFRAHFRVVTYSRRYHWPNERIPEGAEYAMAEHVNDLHRVLESLRPARAHLIGHSYGAYLALMAAIRSPELVDRLVLGEPPVIPLITGFPPKATKMLRQLIARPRSALSVIGFVVLGMVPAASAAKKGKSQTALECMGKAILGSEAFAALPPARLEQVHQNFIEAELLSDSYMVPLNDADVRSVTAPTLLVTGEKSPIVWHRLTDRLAELIPDVRHTEIPGASHIMHEDNAAAYNQAVLKFLR
jgi:pimeloyl-ACP methyl ester carboxylesterase